MTAMRRWRRWRLKRQIARKARAAGLELDPWQLNVLTDFLTLRATCD